MRVATRGSALALAQARAVAAALPGDSELVVADDRMRRGGGGHDDVAALELAGEVVEARDAPAEAVGQLTGALAAAVGHEHRLGALVGECLCGQLAHLSGAEDDDAAVGQVADALPDKINRH